MPILKKPRKASRISIASKPTPQPRVKAASVAHAKVAAADVVLAAEAAAVVAAVVAAADAVVVAGAAAMAADVANLKL